MTTEWDYNQGSYYAGAGEWEYELAISPRTRRHYLSVSKQGRDMHVETAYLLEGEFIVERRRQERDKPETLQADTTTPILAESRDHVEHSNLPPRVKRIGLQLIDLVREAN